MIRILLLDDHSVVRSGYRRLLDAEVGLRVVAEAEDTDAAYAHVSQGGIDVAIVDLSLRGGSGVEAIGRMKARDRHLKVLVLSMHHHTGYVIQAMRAGALGYLTKNCSPDELVEGIRAVSAGRRFIGPDVAQALAHTALDGEQVMARLTVKEFDILRLTVQGQTAMSISEQLHVSHKTVLNNLSVIRHKLGVENDLQLLRLAMQCGLIASDLG
jgi:two-component system, NarL family, invasion response regulator UvrY